MGTHINSIIAVLCVVAMLAPACAYARIPRSHSARAAFQAASPCPANGQTRGSCPGYIADHVIPLCLGGGDDPTNMQWQTVADAAAKDVMERAACRAQRQ